MSISEEVYAEVRPKVVRPFFGKGMFLGLTAIILDLLEYYAVFFGGYGLITLLNIIMPLFGALAVFLIRELDINWKIFLALWFMEGSLMLGILLPFGIVGGVWILYKAVFTKEIQTD